MGILDEAIREHLELKRQHGAADSELKQLEDDAFGPPERPGADERASDAVAEAPTEFMAAPEAGEGEKFSEVPEAADTAKELPRRREAPSVGDLQEAPPPPEPAEEEQPAAEHKTVEPAEAPLEEPTAPEPSPEPAAETEERQAITEQPTEHFDVEEELAAPAKRGPSDEELVEEEMVEPRLAPVDPLADLEEASATEVHGDEPGAEDESVAEDAPIEAEEDDDDFWNEQRLSEELDQALDAPPAEAGSETAEHELEEEGEDEEAEAEEAGEVGEAEDAEEEHLRDHADGDLLEDTPDFLEDAPEDDELWFEQKPPKDFDFDD